MIMLQTWSHMENKLRDNMYTESGQTSQNSFSAVLKRIFATKYLLDHSRRDLHNLLHKLLNPLRSKALKSQNPDSTDRQPESCGKEGDGGLYGW